MSFTSATANPGVGGLNFAISQFTDSDTVQRVLAYSGLAYGLVGAIPTPVSLANGLPVQPATGATFKVDNSAVVADQTATGVLLNPNDAVTLVVSGVGKDTLTVNVSGYTSGNIVLEGMPAAGAAWVQLPLVNWAAGNAITTTTIQGNGTYSAPCPAMSQVRARCSQQLGATVAVAMEVGTGISAVTIAGNPGVAIVGTVQTGAGSLVSLIPATSGGPSRSRIKSAAGTNATNVKASPGQLYGISLSNVSASARYFKFYDEATSPAVGADTPAWTELIPAGSSRQIAWPQGVPFAAGISYAITGGVTDGDATGIVADDVHGVLLFK